MCAAQGLEKLGRFRLRLNNFGMSFIISRKRLCNGVNAQAGLCECGVAGKSGYGTSVVIIYYMQWKEWNGMEDIMAPTATRS